MLPMFTIQLNAQYEYQWSGENPSEKTFPAEKGRFPLYHQWRTYHAEEPIIVNTYTTGTGKTKAALLRLLKRAQDIGFDALRPSRHNALLIAPTNALLAQHVEDARTFCQENELPYRVVALTKEDLETYKAQPGFSEERLRRGATLHSVLNNASKVDDDVSKSATLYVVNPDIFYYALLFCYSQFDRASLFTNFFSHFNYIIIDEFHYYDPKQLTCFLFFMKLSKHMGYIDSSSKKRQFCILTATPRPQVTNYLKNLDIPIAWITPGEIAVEDQPFVKPACALAPVQLQVYSTEELQRPDGVEGSLLLLAELQKWELQAWLSKKLDGAIISSSLGMINRIHQSLCTVISPADLGRITGAELREGRNTARYAPLILATPTVDIGYNFEREKPQRQNIDFLLFDAYSGDELVQRLGRAARVLAKEERHHRSIVLIVVDSTVYTLLQNNQNGQPMERAELGRLAADEMPKRNDLYAYIKTGAILELFRPIKYIGAGTPDANMPDLERFLQDIQRLFEVKRPFSYKDAQRKVQDFDARQRYYQDFSTFPQEAFEMLRLLIDRKVPLDTPLAPAIEKHVEALFKRVVEAQKRHGHVGKNGREVVQWAQRDVRRYAIDKARFSFRDSFQPPRALLYDPERLHSSVPVAFYNALHIIKYYEARFYATAEEWEEASEEVIPTGGLDAFVYCRLLRFRVEPLRIGLKLNANEYTRDEWEEQYGYQVTALYGLEVVPLDDHHGLDWNVQSLISTQYVPAFVALQTTDGATARELYTLRKQARFFPLHLTITFCDGQEYPYLIILGAMAFQVCAEIPYRAIAIDRHKTQREDESLFIF